jgi:glycerol-3-phosphate acyltransferase PlsY
LNPDLATWIAGVALAGYLLGSIPFGVLLTRGAGLGDVRAIGSGNIGATNVLRTGRKDLALLTLLLDGGKGAVAVLLGAGSLPWAESLLGTRIDPEWRNWAGAAAGAAAFLGHLFPVWLGFRGGKGVATFFGLMLAAAWPVGLAAGATWLLVAAASRLSSLAALAAAVLAPNLAALTGQPTPVILLAAFGGVLILVKHRGNIARLRGGTEPRIGRSARPAGSDVPHSDAPGT